VQNYYRTIYISNFKVPPAAVPPPPLATIAEYRFTTPLDPIRPPVQLVRQNLNANRIEIAFDFDAAIEWITPFEVPARLPARAPATPSGGPVMVPSLLTGFQPQNFSSLDPIRLPPRRPDPAYGIQTWFSAWYSAAPSRLEYVTGLLPQRLPLRLTPVDYRGPIQPENIRESSLWQPPVIVSPLPARIVPQAAFNVPVPPITIDAVVTRRQADPIPGRLPTRGPWGQPAFLGAPEYVVTLDKWRQAPELPIRPLLPTTQGGNFAPPIVPTFDIIAWWAPSPVPMRPPQRLTPVSFFNLGLPLPGDASTVSRVDWHKPIVVRPPVRGPHTQSTQPSFQSYDLTISGFGTSLQPIRSKHGTPLGGSALAPAFIGLEVPQCFADSRLPLRPSQHTPAAAMQFVRIVVAMDFPQAMPQPIVLPRRALILPNSFTPPAVSDSTEPRFSTMPQPIAMHRRQQVEPGQALEISLFSAPPALSWAQQPVTPIRQPNRSPWLSPSMMIFRPNLATTGHAAAAWVRGG